MCSLHSSYTYDVTQNLQYNMSLIDRSFSKLQKCECKCHMDVSQGKNDVSNMEHDRDSSESVPSGGMDIKIDGRLSERSYKESDSCVETKVDVTKKLKGSNHCQECLKHCVQQHHFVSRRGKPCGQFIWNKHMLKLLNDVVHPDWLLCITHGFVGQCSILYLLD